MDVTFFLLFLLVMPGAIYYNNFLDRDWLLDNNKLSLGSPVNLAHGNTDGKNRVHLKLVDEQMLLPSPIAML